MKKTNKENPLTFFRKANEARQKVVKNSLTKARNGVVVPAVVNSIRNGYWSFNEDGTLNTNPQPPRPSFLDPTDPLKKVNYDQKKIDDFNKKYPNGVPGPSSLKRNKKGGSVNSKNK